MNAQVSSNGLKRDDYDFQIREKHNTQSIQLKIEEASCKETKC